MGFDLGDIGDSFSLSGITDSIGLTNSGAGKEAQQAAMYGAQVAANAQKESLDYLKEINKLPMELRDFALEDMAGLYGFGEHDGAEALNRIKSSPLYQQQMQTIEGAAPMAEEAILRNASAAGRLRGGSTIEDLAGFQQYQQQAKNQLLQGQLQGLSSFSQMPNYARDIANTTAGIGQTLGQGIIGGAQSRLDADQANSQNMMGLGQLAIGGGYLMGFSDSRLKQNVEHVGTKNGHNWYTWAWNKTAEKLGLTGNSEGVIAQEILKTKPESISTKEGYLVVDYGSLGVIA